MPKYLLTFSDLPSSDFENLLKEAIDLNYLEKNALNEKDEGKIDNWIEHFIVILGIHYADLSTQHENVCGKRCRDLNYMVNYVKNKMSILDRSWGSQVKFTDNLISKINTNFSKKGSLDFSRRDNFITDDIDTKKKLDDYCEHRDYIREKIIKDKNVNTCSIFLNYINEKKEYFLDKGMKCKGSEDNDIPCHINDDCSMQNIDKTFPTINCDIYIEPPYMALKFLMLKNIYSTFTPLRSFLLNRNKNKHTDYNEYADMDTLEYTTNSPFENFMKRSVKLAYQSVAE
ncbi:PIR Superfamily Protein [Plasmodium ovale wallikeri]|uniref:PIR Superfamily Protein n=1 Tax=Plasmodium ovale wallikeri TaxID=864142 RepID=A0A1A9ATG2_PLAOA|nr:PIR Superfamily Protein [Plasmodium ovale wallikeri]